MTEAQNDGQLYLLGYNEGRADGIREAADLIDRHSCMSSCCDAQPGAGEAEALANCIRGLLPPPSGGEKAGCACLGLNATVYADACPVHAPKLEAKPWVNR